VVDPFANEASLLRLHHDWSVNGVLPQFWMSGAKILEDKDETSEGSKKNKTKHPKRIKKDVPVKD